MHSFIISFTQTGGAQAQFAFSGEAVAVYGTVSPAHADYTATTDGVTKSFPGGSNGLASSLHVGVSTSTFLLPRADIFIICRRCWSVEQSLHQAIWLIPPQYFANELTDGPHHLTLTANPAQSGQYHTGKFMDIDRIVIFSASNGTSTTNDSETAMPSGVVDTINPQGGKNLV